MKEDCKDDCRLDTLGTVSRWVSRLRVSKTGMGRATIRPWDGEGGGVLWDHGQLTHPHQKSLLFLHVVASFRFPSRSVGLENKVWSRKTDSCAVALCITRSQRILTLYLASMNCSY